MSASSFLFGEIEIYIERENEASFLLLKRVQELYVFFFEFRSFAAPDFTKMKPITQQHSGFCELITIHLYPTQLLSSYSFQKSNHIAQFFSSSNTPYQRTNTN
jgi:hypothetical protein